MTRLKAELLELGDGIVGHLVFYPRTAAEGPRGFVFDHPTDLDPSGSCGGAVIWENPDGSRGRFTLVSSDPLEISEQINCRCGIKGHIRGGKWVPLAELGRPHSKGRQRQGAERRAPAELERRLHEELPC